MIQEETTILTATFSEVLANLAFMFRDDGPVEADPTDTWLETTIGYRGPESGALRLWCSRRFSTLLAANLLGVDPEDEDATSKKEDAVKEFMNIVCGQLVTAMHGVTAVFDLSIPQTMELEDSPPLHESDVQATTLSVEGHPIRLAYVPVEDGIGPQASI